MTASDTYVRGIYRSAHIYTHVCSSVAQIWKLGDLDAHRKQGELVVDVTEHYAAPEVAACCHDEQD